jgi:hypothetical protein
MGTFDFNGAKAKDAPYPRHQGAKPYRRWRDCKPLITKEMGYYWLSQRVNKNERKLQNPYFTDGRDIKTQSNHPNNY